MDLLKARAEKKGRALELDLPELDPEEYLVGVMFDLKPTRIKGYDGHGNAIPEPTDWPVIGPFGDAMGIEADDLLILSKMCRGYYDAWREGENPLCIPPVERG